jgi:hypothetical protein
MRPFQLPPSSFLVIQHHLQRKLADMCVIRFFCIWKLLDWWGLGGVGLDTVFDNPGLVRTCGQRALARGVIGHSLESQV